MSAIGNSTAIKIQKVSVGLRSIALCLTLGLLISPAQTSFGRISGTVVDPTDAAVANAKISLRETGTGATRTVLTDSNGFFAATNLAVGNYTVDVDQQGFKRLQRSGLQLVADGKITVDFRLQVGDVTQSVDVVAAQVENLNTVSGEVSRTIDSKQLENLTMNGRNYVQLMTLVPGAIVTNPDQFSVTTSLASNTQNINGNRSDANNLTVDGAYNSVAGSNSSLVNNVSPDFIEEVKLQTSNFSAEYGRFSGPAFNVVTKNGTNQFHGGAVEFFRNDALDARNFFAAKKTELRFNNFGYFVGGPIKKDKLFFFFGEEWKRLRQQATPTRQTVPTTAMLSGDFSGQAQLFFPGTKTPIPGNNISSLITADGKAIANVYSLMSQQASLFTNTPTSNNVTLAPSNPLNFREELLRLDYRVNDKQSLYGRWIQDANVLIDPFGTFSSSNLPTTPTTRSRPGESFLLAETWLPAPNMVNEARASASWVSQHIPPYGNTWQRSTYGFQFQQLYPGGSFPDGIPQVSITSYATFQGPNFALMSPTTDINFSDTFSWIKSGHIVKAGFVLIRDRVDQNGRPSYLGNITFNASGNPNTTGNALADALIGNFRTYTEASADPVGFFRFWEPEAFVQDNWKVSRKLSLEFGVRWQYLQPMYTQANNMVNFVPALFNRAQAVSLTTAGLIVPNSGNPYNGLIRAGSGIPSSEQGRVPGSTGPLYSTIPAGAPRGLYSSASEFAPRFGFAYSITDKMIVRGGFGMFYNRPEGNVTFSQVNIPPILQISEFDNANLNNITAGSPATQSPIGGISAIAPNLKNAYVEQFSLGVQRELPWNLFLETSYVGSLGRHLLREPNINYPDLAQVAANPSYSTNYFVPYPGYTSVQQYLSDSTSNYHSLQVYLSKRAGNITFTAAYTWSKALGDASGEGDNSENYTNRHFNYGPLSYDRRHAFSGSFVWAMPLLRDQKAIVRQIAGGWQTSGVIRLQSGPYLTVNGNTPTGTRRADYLGGAVYPDSQNINNWVNKSAFAASPTGRWGNAGINTVLGPGLQSYDISLAKNFPLTERVTMRFQGDFFNLFNIANFTGLNTTITSSAFGTIASAYPARNVQLALKLTF